MEAFILIALLFVAGIALNRVPAFPRDSAMAFNMYVVYIALPAMILRHLPTLPLSTRLLTPVVTPWLMLLFSVGVVLLLGRLLSWPRDIVGALLMVATMGNTSFLGVPMVQAHFGNDHVAYALLYDQLGSFLILATYGAVIIALYSHDPQKHDGQNREAGRQENSSANAPVLPTPSPAAIIKKVATFPPFIALILAFTLRGVPLPETVTSILIRLSDTLVPVVIVAVGFQFKLRIDARYATPLAAGLLIKMVLAPLVVLGTVRLLGLTGPAVDIAIFEAGMPAMITAGALAMAAGLAPSLVASLVGLGIILSFMTLWLLHLIIAW